MTYPYEPANGSGTRDDRIDRILRWLEIVDLENIDRQLRRITEAVRQLSVRMEQLMTDINADFQALDAAVDALTQAVQDLATRVGQLQSISPQEKADLEARIQAVQAATTALGNVAPTPPAA